MAEPLKPCPCGSKAELHEDIAMSGKGQFWVQSEAGWGGPTKSEPDDAVDAWNTRLDAYLASPGNTDPMTIAKYDDELRKASPSREAIALKLQEAFALKRNGGALPMLDAVAMADAILSLSPASPAPVWRPDWEGFGRALMEDWPTGDIDGSHLFDMSLKYGLIAEVPGGYNPDEHIDAEGICPERGDPWYEYTFGSQPTEQPPQADVQSAAREGVVDEIEDIIAETHEIDVTDRNYAENIVSWMELHYPAAIRTLAGEEGK